jgi:hypothetical protein
MIRVWIAAKLPDDRSRQTSGLASGARQIGSSPASETKRIGNGDRIPDAMSLGGRALLRGGKLARLNVKHVANRNLVDEVLRGGRRLRRWPEQLAGFGRRRPSP